MSHTYNYNWVIKNFVDEMIREKISPEEIKHLEERRIKEIALKGLKTASKGELTHLFHCPKCVTRWSEFKFKLDGKRRQKAEKKQIYSAEPKEREK